MSTTSSFLLNAKYKHGQTPLIMACDALNVELVKALINERVNLDEQDDFKTTALIATIKSLGCDRTSEPLKLEIVQALISAGADINKINKK